MKDATVITFPVLGYLGTSFIHWNNEGKSGSLLGAEGGGSMECLRRGNFCYKINLLASVYDYVHL